MNKEKNNYLKWLIIAIILVVYTGLVVIITTIVNSNLNLSEGSHTVENEDTVEVVSTNGEKIEKGKNIELQEKVIEKDWEISVVDAGFKQDIVPSNPQSFYTHYQVEDTDNTYAYIVVDAKNTSTLGLRADSMAQVKFKYDGKYEYVAFSTIEETGGGTFTYTNITNVAPLTTRKIYYLAEVPKTITEEQDTSFEAEITINNNIYKLKIK